MPRNLDEMLRNGSLRALAGTAEAGPLEGPSCEQALSLEWHDVPIINLVTAGDPGAFTDLGYPAGVADEFIRAPITHDPDAFACRVTGDSMEPAYREGDILIVSPTRSPKAGVDCFARIEPDHEVTVKRAYFETSDDGAELIRLQPLNPRYKSKTYPRERIAMLCPVVFMVRPVA